MRGKCYLYALESLFDLYAELSTGSVLVTPTCCAFTFGNTSAPVANIPQLGGCPRLVHGFVIGDEGEVKDEKFGHAWLEGNGYVMDCGSVEKTHELYGRDVYYEHWRINPQECRRYTIHEATRRVIASGKDSGWNDSTRLDEVTLSASYPVQSTADSHSDLVRRFPHTVLRGRGLADYPRCAQVS